MWLLKCQTSWNFTFYDHYMHFRMIQNISLSHIYSKSCCITKLKIIVSEWWRKRVFLVILDDFSNRFSLISTQFILNYNKKIPKINLTVLKTKFLISIFKCWLGNFKYSPYQWKLIYSLSLESVFVNFDKTDTFSFKID